MRVLQLVQKPQRRGPEILAQRLNRALRDLGHQAKTVFLYHFDGDQPLHSDSGDTLLAGNERSALETTLGFQPRLLAAVKREIRDFDPDIVQVNGSRSVKYGAFAKGHTGGSPWSLVYRNIDNPDYWVRGRVRQLYYRHLVMPRMDGVISVSRGMREVLTKHYGFAVPMTYIPYVVDPARLEPLPDRTVARAQLGLDAFAPVVLFIGTLSEQKRPDRLVRVMAQVRKAIPNTLCCVVGDGPLANDTRVAARGERILDSMQLVGYQRSIGPFLAAADLLLVTSDSDGIPTVVQEAGYAGLPTVATRVGGMDECVKDGVTGLLADPADEELLAECVTRLLRDDAERLAMGEAARDLVRSEYTLDVATARHLDFYESLRRGRKAR